MAHTTPRRGRMAALALPALVSLALGAARPTGTTAAPPFGPPLAGVPTDELRYYALADGMARALATAQQARFLVAGNDWEIAPDGRTIAFRSATDGAIWVLSFGP